jgi:hypothetical protein
VKKEAAAKKKDEGQPKNKITYPRLRAARKLPTHLQVIVGVKAKTGFESL